MVLCLFRRFNLKTLACDAVRWKNYRVVAEENAQIVREVLQGQVGAKRDVVLLNAAFALVAAGLAKDIEVGIEKARAAIDDGLAEAKLEGLVNYTNL